jgi:hypothetical protein
MLGKDWKQFIPIYFYTIWGLGGAVMAGLSSAFSITKILSLVMAGIISWGFVEYGLHRFIFHHDARSQWGQRMVYQMHMSHHEFPKALDQLFSGLRTSAPIATIYFLLGWIILGHWQATAFLFLGLIIGYFSYELLHYQAHHLAPKWRIFQYMKKYHMLHHHQSPKLRYGVTTPLFDLLFGTFASVKTRVADEAISGRRN